MENSTNWRVDNPASVEHRELAMSMKQALQVSRRIGQELKISLNQEFGNKLMTIGPAMPVLKFGAMKLLLAGDGHWEDILKGLAHPGKLSAQGDIHVNVLKVQHRGSEHNLKAKFCQAVIADDYIFCGNGAHENPDLDAIQTVVDSRLGAAARRRKHPQVGDAFKLWFNSHGQASNVAADRTHLAKVETLVKKLTNQSGGFISRRVGSEKINRAFTGATTRFRGFWIRPQPRNAKLQPGVVMWREAGTPRS